MKKLKCALAAIMICLTACLCGACSTEEEQPVVTTTQNTQTFITIVSQIQEPVTVDDGAKIEVALIVYEYLSDAEKGNSDVSSSKTRLDQLKTKYDAVKAEADRQAEIAREEKLVSDFVSAVNRLPDDDDKFKLSDRETIDELIIKYGELKDASKEKSEVVAAYGKLTAADEKVSDLEVAARQQIIRETAEKFIDAVKDTAEKVEEADADSRNEALLKAGDAIKNLLYDYDDFENEVKDYDGVADAKKKLDGLYVEYAVLRDAKDVEEFLELVEALKPIDEKVTLENETAINNAEYAYRYMSDEAKAVDGVADAYAVLLQAREKFEALFAVAEAERIQIFIAAVNKVGEKTGEIDISWFDVLDEASRAYGALAWASHDLPEVKEARAIWDAVQIEFNKKGYQRIPMSDPKIVYSGDTPPHLVLENHADMLNPVVEFYNLSSYTEISQHAILWLHVYVDGVYVARGELDTAKFLPGGHIMPNSEIVNVLNALSAEHSEIKRGANFSFAMSFEDRNNNYIPSDKTNVSQSKVYSW